MKPNDIQRSVRAQRFERAVGDAPDIGRVSRIPGAARPKGIRKKKRRSESRQGIRQRSRQKSVILAWSAVLLLLAIGVIGTAVVLWIKSSKANSSSAESGSKAASPAEKRALSRFESPTEQAALDCVKRALSARDPATVSKHFRLGTTDPATVVSFLNNLTGSEGQITGYSWLSSMDRNGLLIDGVIVRRERGFSPKNRLALLTPDESGKWQVDYDAFARTCTPPCEEVLDPKYTGGLIRTFVAPDRYYNSVFANDAIWSCFRLSSPDWKDVLLGYCRRNSSEWAALNRIIENANIAGENPGTIRAVLEIDRVEGAEPRQFRISRVLAEDWVLSDKPFDERFQ